MTQLKIDTWNVHTPIDDANLERPHKEHLSLIGNWEDNIEIAALSTTRREIKEVGATYIVLE